jgi:hypothetical protein
MSLIKDTIGHTVIEDTIKSVKRLFEQVDKTETGPAD